jgi:hypothetical protein
MRGCEAAKSEEFVSSSHPATHPAPAPSIIRSSKIGSENLVGMLPEILALYPESMVLSDL